MNIPGYTEVLLSVGLVLLSIIISRFWKIDAAKDIAIGSVRTFVQLIAVGYAINYIFDLKSIWLISLALLIMILVGAQSGASQSKKIKGAFVLLFLAIASGSIVTIGSMLLLKIISPDARYLIPLGGMIIGNSMNAATLSINRLDADIRGNTLAIETALSLGKTWRFASKKQIKDAITTGIISMINSMKTVGIVALPGAMTGMILAGADPLDAVLLQIIVMYMLMFAVTLTSIIVVELTVRRYFTINHQLKIV